MLGRSCLNLTLCNVKMAVGPWGKCEIVREVGTPLCSCKMIKSVICTREHDLTNSGMT